MPKAISTCALAGLAAPLITNVTGWLQEGCQAGLTGRQLYLQQDLFTIFVHRSPKESSSPPDSIFYRRDIPERYADCVSLRILVQ
jgi:hypothetical protein